MKYNEDQPSGGNSRAAPRGQSTHRHIDGNGYCQQRCGRRAYGAWGAKHQWRMYVDIECTRLRAWSRVVEDDFGKNSIQAGLSVGCVSYFKACAERKSETARAWGWTSACVGYLHAGQFACCLAFCLRGQRWGWRVLLERDYRSDRGRWSNIWFAAEFAQEPSHLDICT